MGWTCPKCGAVYGPTVEECRRCNDGTIAPRWPVSPQLPPYILPPYILWGFANGAGSFSSSDGIPASVYVRG